MAALLVPSLSSFAQQLLINGSFETGAAGTMPGAPYSVGLEAGSSVTLSTAQHSPFVNVYPLGNQSVYLTDGGDPFGIGAPWLRQTFAPQSAPTLLQINVDFFLPGTRLGSDAWWILFKDANGNQGFGATINNYENGIVNSFSIGVTSVLLQPNQWYNVLTVINLQTAHFTTTLTRFGGSPQSFSYGLSPGTTNLAQIEIGNFFGGLGSSQPIFFDNLSVAVVPEPSVASLILISLFVGWVVLARRWLSLQRLRPQDTR
jgi:hypothetical protein